MADNTTLNTGSGGDTLATDDIAGVKYPRSKIVLGADGSNDGDVSSANPLPVTGTLTAVTSITNTVTVDGSGVTQPVSGTVTANLSATDNAVLDSIDAAVNGTLTVGSHAVTNAGTFAVQVDGTALTRLTDIETNTSYGAVTGGGVEASALRVTIANDSTGLVSVDDGGSSLTVDGTVTANLSATDNAVLDSIDSAINGTLTVGTHAVTQSGTWNVGTVTTITNAVTVAAANDASLNVTIGDGSNTATIRNLASNDALNVAIVDGSGNQVTSFGGSGGTSATDDSAFTAGSGSGTPVMGFFSSDTVDAGDVGVLAMDASRRLLCSIEVDNVGIGGGTQYTESDALGVSPTGTLGMMSRDNVLSTLTEVEGDAVRMRSDGLGALWVRSTEFSLLAGSSVAHDAADANAPHKIGAKAVNSISDQTLVADDDRTDLYAGEDGVLITRPHCHLADVVSEVDTNTDGASTAFGTGLAAPGAGIRLYITRVTIANSSSSFCTVDLRDGSAGSVLWTVPVPAEGGVTQTFDPPLKLTANTALAYDASAATSTLTISGLGFTSKV